MDNGGACRHYSQISALTRENPVAITVYREVTAALDELELNNK